MIFQPSNATDLQLQRRQFPVRAAFAMTINKAQGQEVVQCGVLLPRNSFAHGQVYTALSRSCNPRFMRVLVMPASQIQAVLWRPPEDPFTTSTAHPALAGGLPPHQSNLDDAAFVVRINYTKNVVFAEVLTNGSIF